MITTCYPICYVGGLLKERPPEESNLIGITILKNDQRSIRRHHRDRLKQNRKYYWGDDLNSSAKRWSMAVNTPCPCSCWMCGHQRKHLGPTLKEQSSLFQFHLDLKDYFQGD